AVNAPDRTGGSKSSPSEGNPEKSSSIAVVGFVVAPATSSITGQSTLCSGLSTLAVPYHREAAPWDATSLDKQRPRSLDQFPLTTTAKSLGCSRSAPAESASRLSPRSCDVASTRSRRKSFQPRAAAAKRRVARACPTSCWQYRNARSPYFQASRQ